MQAAAVLVHDRRVGYVERVSSDEDFIFRFDAGWLEDPDRPTLGQLFVDRMPEPIATSGLPCWFAHLLPQGPAKRLYQRWCGLDPEEDDGFTLLVSIGGDLPGAVSLAPTEPGRAGPGAYTSAPELPDGAPGFSLPGVQAKLSVRMGDRGLVMPVRGERVGDFIAKFHDPTYAELPRLEWATTEWARQSGIRVHEARIVSTREFVSVPDGLPLGDGQVFLARRFDRIDGGRVHAEDFGQILDRPPGHPGQYQGSYETIGRVIAVLCHQDVREYVDRLVFMLMSGNGDAHLKNWGVLYPDRRHPRLGPAYDMVSTVCRVPGDDLALSFVGRKRFADITTGCFDELATYLGVDARVVGDWVRDTCERVRDAWARCRSASAFSDSERQTLERHMGSLSL